MFLDRVMGMKDVFDQFTATDKEIVLQNARTLILEIGITPQRDPFAFKDAANIVTPTPLLKGDQSPAFLREHSRHDCSSSPALRTEDYGGSVSCDAWHASRGC